MSHASRVVIVGGGLAGLLLACVVRERCGQKASVSIIERAFPSDPEHSMDTRATAISRGSKEIFEAWSLWTPIAAQAKPIENIHVSRAFRFGSSSLRDSMDKEGPLGWVVENSLLQRVLLNRCLASGVNIIDASEVTAFSGAEAYPKITLDSGDKLEADLAIIADGAESSSRAALGIGAIRHPPAQYAIAVNCETNGPDEGTAFERFTDQGPLALLPIPNSSNASPRYNVIWCAHEETQKKLMSLSNEDFIAALQREFGWRAGAITGLGRRTGWPLKRVVARELVRPRCILLGNSAHTLHPVAGQGFNLSVRDVARLEQLFLSEIEEARPFSSLARLEAYEHASQLDHDQTIAATSLLAGILDSPPALLDAGVSMAVAVLDLVGPAKRAVTDFGMGKR